MNAPEDGQRTALYRLYDADGSLLYVGMTSNLRSRMVGHAADKPWWAAVARQTTEWYDTRAEAAAAEAEAIKSENPIHNIQGTSKHREHIEAGFERRRRRIENEESDAVNRIRAKRAGRYWELYVDGVGVTQSRNLGAEADEMIRSRISMATGASADGADYCIVAEIDAEIDAEVAEARRSAREAEDAVTRAAVSNRTVARRLRDAGLTGRDIAAILEITPQRVSQLLQPLPTPRGKAKRPGRKRGHTNASA